MKPLSFGNHFKAFLDPNSILSSYKKSILWNQKAIKSFFLFNCKRLFNSIFLAAKAALDFTLLVRYLVN